MIIAQFGLIPVTLKSFYGCQWLVELSLAGIFIDRKAQTRSIFTNQTLKFEFSDTLHIMFGGERVKIYLTELGPYEHQIWKPKCK